MNDSISPQNGEKSEPNCDETEWIRAVISAALLHTDLSFDQAARILEAATAPVRAVGTLSPDMGPFTPVPQAEDWPELTSAATIAARRTPPPLTSRGLGTDPKHRESRASVDDVMAPATASVEGYRSTTRRVVGEWLAIIVVCLVVTVLLQRFVLQAFEIPTGSMVSTVNVDDRVLVNKLSYEFGDVGRGDLVVFDSLAGTPAGIDALLKRVLALPGETIELRADGHLWIWGPGQTPADAQQVDEPYLDAQNFLLNAPSPTDGPSDNIWHENCVNDSSNPARCTLDSSSYYMMGDNRNQSFDSRGFGPVPEENLVGRAFFRIWPLGDISTL